MWPFKKAPVEKRQDASSYTDVVIRALVAAATGEEQDTAHGTAAAETAASLYSRAFLMARISPKSAATKAVTPSMLANVAREMVVRGESMYLIRVTGGEVELAPVGSWDIRGGDDKADWTVRVDTYGPTSSSTTTTVPYSGVLHFAWSYDSALPWVGVGPLSRATITGSLHGGLERSLGYEVGGPVGHLLPTPAGPDTEDEDDDPLGDLRRDIANLRGAAALVETTSGNWEASSIGARAETGFRAGSARIRLHPLLTYGNRRPTGCWPPVAFLRRSMAAVAMPPADARRFESSSTHRCLQWPRSSRKSCAASWRSRT